MKDRVSGLQRRIEAIDWADVTGVLDRQGWAVLPGLLDATARASLVRLYGEAGVGESGEGEGGKGGAFRSRVVMARHGFGRGEYAYFAYPLPSLVAHLRSSLYPSLAPIANGWHQRLGNPVRFPAAHADFIVRCHLAGQTRPTPLLLQYGSGDFNCLHQDLYGAHVFPLQVAILLSAPGADFEGGEFVLTEQRPRMQSRVTVVPLQAGDAVVFAVSHRPVQGARGDYRVTLRHGVSTVRLGHRHTLGVIFHDAA